jgi:YfiH family protein
MQNFPSKLLNKYSNILYAFTTKADGNLAFHVGEAKESVIANHKRVSQKLNYELSSLVHMQQIHSNKVKVLSKQEDFFHPPECDALITNEKNRPLMVMVADCTPLLLYDTKKELIAVIHAGRAGAFKNIIARVIEKLQTQFHSNPHDIIISIGASICQECYEVGEDVYKEAHKKKLQYALKKRGKSYFLDIKKILLKQLRESGVLQSNIEVMPHCSKCHPAFFSYREEKECGRFAGIIMLR